MATPDQPTDSATTTPQRRFSDDAVDMAASMQSSLRLRSRSSSPIRKGWKVRLGVAGVARRTLGICLLLATVCMWTLSNFLASFIFSDHTYDKPFFLVYVNTSVFALALLPRFVVYITKNGLRGLRSDVSAMWMEHKQQGMSIAKAPLDSNRESQEFSPVSGNDDDDDIGRETTTGERLLIDEEIGGLTSFNDVEEKLNLRETALLSLEFCMLWFFANYFASACLEYTSVASTTILTSTSSVWTLVFCAILRVEPFSLRKLVGVMASLVGIVLTSTIDLTGGADEDRGSFPHKTPSQIAIGDSMAFLSAVVYGMYVTVMKKRVGNEDRVDMQLFFGLVGVINLLCLWPLFFILHWTDIEPFEMPPSGQIWLIIIVNSLSSFIGDLSWAFAMLLTTPLVVTVGLSLTIPLSLIGEMIQYGQYSSFVYWIGAGIVFMSFLFINNESQGEGDSTNSAL